MIQVTAQTRIFVATAPADFRRGIDGLAKLARDELDCDPFCGALFVFRNKRQTALKILAYDGQGFWLCQKRLSSGRFRHWLDSETNSHGILEGHELSVLLRGGDPNAVKGAQSWRALA